VPELTITVIVKRRSLLGRLRRLPRAFRQHYRVFRGAHGRLVSAYGAWVMAGFLITFPREQA
jgi:hypothetical protein